MKKQFRIFISSVQDEFSSERKLLKKWLTTDPFISRFVSKVFLFEDTPSREKSPSEVYLDAVKESDIYIGLLGSRYYGLRGAQRGVSATELFEHLGLIKDGVYTWAAALCFAVNPQRWCYRATLKCAWCEGRVFTRPFLDSDKFEGNLFDLQKSGVDFVMSRLAQSRGIRNRGMQVPVHAEIPREAVEEALVNALVHRDWRLSASVEIRLLSDRVEIWTPGKLPRGLTIASLFNAHASFPVNDLVLKVFDFAGLIESLGTGIKRMVDACKRNGNPPPEFRQEGLMFVAVLKRPTGRRKKARRTTVQKTTQQTTQQTTYQTTQQTTQQASEEVRVLASLKSRLTGTALRLALYLMQNPTAKIDDIMTETGLSRDGINYQIRMLKRKVGLSRSGAFQDSRWQFTLPKALRNQYISRRRTK